MGPIGMPEILIIVAILFLLFGATKLPQLAKALGQSKKAFKEGLREGEEEEEAKNLDRVTAGAVAPQIKEMDDADLEAEMKRRAEARAEH